MKIKTSELTGAADLLDLIEAYAEARHRQGHSSYNTQTAAALQAVKDALAAGQATAAPENIRGILARCRDFIDTTKAPAYPAGADLADEIDVLLAAQPAPQPSHVAQAVVQDDLITLRKPTTSAELLWLLKLAHLVISDMDKTMEETFSPAQPVAEPAKSAAYAALPEYGINTASHAHFRVLGFTADQMRAFADATHALRATQGQAPAQPDPAYSAACNLATALFKKHFAHLPDYASGQVVWGLFDSTEGVILQIDNMVSGLVQPPTTSPQADSVQEDAARLEIGKTKGGVSPRQGVTYAALPEPLEIDWPELHSQALGCGVEDRDLHNRYECAEYGWQDGVDKCAERVPEQIFDADQMLAFADATHMLRASHGQAPAGVTLRSMIEGMSVSVDVSTGDNDAGHRYFGTVTEVMECQGNKHGVTLLVQDAEPNFTATPTAPATQQAGAEPPGIQALMCVISSLRDMAHFSDEEGGELMSALCALRDWAHAQPAPATQQAGATKEHVRLVRVIADKIEDGTLFRSGIYSNKDLARFVRNVADAAAPQFPTTQAQADSVQEDAARESEYQRGYRHGYEQRDAEVRGAMA